MATRRTSAPPGWPTVIPRLSVADPKQCVGFLKDVFGALGCYSDSRPSEIRIGDSLVMIGSVLERAPTSSFLYVYVPDVDLAFQNALLKGAKPLEAPEEMPYGDRRAMIEDPWGNRWQIATHRGFKDDA